jgi:AmmeMemoRadiSam system protein B
MDRKCSFQALAAAAAGCAALCAALGSPVDAAADSARCSAPPPPSQERSLAIRVQKDTIGYATRPEQVESLVRLVDSLEAPRYAANESAFPLMRKRTLAGAICPHDDYLYAGRGYVHVMREVRAPLVILLGVSHTARRRGIQGRLVFDTFDAWRVGGRDCPISPMRDEIIASLPPELVLVSDEMHSEEHSLEGFVPILQHYVPAVEIVPILVTRQGDGFERTADTLAVTLRRLMRKHEWKLGTEVALLISADCVHYGDEEWGGRNYAPFGADSAGYARGVAQDLEVIRSSLTGAVGAGKRELFRDRVDSGEFQQPYRITWCGVYSIPFGLAVLERLCGLSNRNAPEGFMLVYGTSIDPPMLPLEHTGLGTTAIATIRHWVGYTGIGYW